MVAMIAVFEEMLSEKMRRYQWWRRLLGDRWELRPVYDKQGRIYQKWIHVANENVVQTLHQSFPNFLRLVTNNGVIVDLIACEDYRPSAFPNDSFPRIDG